MRFDAQWWAERAQASHPGRPEAKALAAFDRWIAPLVRLMHRPTLEGLEHLPQQGPFMLVANHSGAMAISEILCLIVLYMRHFDARPLAATAHPLSFHLWPMTWGMRWTGAIPSARQPTLQTLGEGVSVLVFPGGDHESCRPFWQANRVDFNHRQGFLRIAHEAGVPIVPMGIRGSHLSAPVLWRSRWLLPFGLVLPRLFGLKRYPMTLSGALGLLAALVWGPSALGWPLTLGLAWLWMASLLPLVPYVPVRITMRLGAPMNPATLFSEPTPDFEAAHERVQGTIQALVLSR